MASTFGMRVSTSNLTSTGTGTAVVALAQNTLSVSAGVSTGDVGRLAGVIGPSKKKKMAEVVPKPSSRSSAFSIASVLFRNTSTASPMVAPLLRSVPSPSPGRPWSK